MKNTEKVSGDALMYLLTILMRTKLNKNNMIIEWKVTVNKGTEVEEYLICSGFANFFNDTSKLPDFPNENNSKIITGINATPQQFKPAVEFIEEKTQNKSFAKYMYPIFIELITNTVQHAYRKKMEFHSAWYIYVENFENKIKITFMDNGDGIPKTVKRKYFKETIIPVQHRLLESALNGEFRTETNLSYRGKGLKDIYERIKKENVKEFTIISNKAYYDLNRKMDMKESITGTIFYIEFEYR